MQLTIEHVPNPRVVEVVDHENGQGPVGRSEGEPGDRGGSQAARPSA